MNEGERKDKIEILRERHDFGLYVWIFTIVVANPCNQLFASGISLWINHHSLRIMQGGSCIFMSVAVALGICAAMLEFVLDKRQYRSGGSESIWWEICTGAMLLI